MPPFVNSLSRAFRSEFRIPLHSVAPRIASESGGAARRAYCFFFMMNVPVGPSGIAHLPVMVVPASSRVPSNVMRPF